VIEERGEGVPGPGPNKELEAPPAKWAEIYE